MAEPGRYVIPLTDEETPVAAAPAPAASSGRYVVPTTPHYADIVPGLAQGASLEWGDELAGLVGGEDWRRRYKDWVREASERSPGLYEIGKFGGAVGTSLVPGALALRGAGAAARAAPSLWQLAGAGAGIGAGTGAIEALGESES